MKEILLVGINARYNHTNLAIRSIFEYSKKYLPTLDENTMLFEEWTISQFPLEILRGIVKHNPKIVIFSVYIWNTRLVFDIIQELRKVAPKIIIGVGGPDVSYRADDLFFRYSELDIVLQGEGEQTVLELVQSYESLSNFKRDDFLSVVSTIKGLYVRTSSLDICFGGKRDLIENLDRLAFAYPIITEVDTKLYYYESSRGCPFTCSYCLSSIEKSVRFMPLDRVYTDLQKFLDARVKIVKFVDRTFNLNTERYLAIWKYIIENHNGYTMFHFEISAEHLDERALAFLQDVPAGIMQFEIGIQSICEETLHEIQRPVNLDKLRKNILHIPKTIHSHLDIIAGLPHETIQTFSNAFNFTMGMNPDMLQMGFLKILSGTQMEKFAKLHRYEWLSNPMYEVLKTPTMSYEDLCFLHDVEQVLDWFYNSHYVDNTVQYLLQQNITPYDLFSSITKYFQNLGLFEIQHKTLTLFSYLHEYLSVYHEEDFFVLAELLRFDYFYMGKTSVFPECFALHYNKDSHHKALLTYTDMNSTREAYTNSSYEVFNINPFSHKKEKTEVLFLYTKRAEKQQNPVVKIL